MQIIVRNIEILTNLRGLARTLKNVVYSARLINDAKSKKHENSDFDKVVTHVVTKLRILAYKWELKW